MICRYQLQDIILFMNCWIVNPVAVFCCVLKISFFRGLYSEYKHAIFRNERTLWDIPYCPNKVALHKESNTWRNINRERNLLLMKLRNACVKTYMYTWRNTGRTGNVVLMKLRNVRRNVSKIHPWRNIERKRNWTARMKNRESKLSKMWQWKTTKASCTDL